MLFRSSFATLRGMHLLSGMMLLLVIAYRGALGLRGLLRRGPPGLSPAPLWREALSWWRGEQPRADWAARLVRLGGWGFLLLLIVTGIVRHFRLRYGWSPVAPGPPALWDVLHVSAVPYLYGFLLLVGYLRLRRWLPALREYLVRQY